MNDCVTKTWREEEEKLTQKRSVLQEYESERFNTQEVVYLGTNLTMLMGLHCHTLIF